MDLARRLALAGAACALLAACGTSAAGSPTWGPSPPYAAGTAQASPILPVPTGTGGSGGTGGGPALPGGGGITVAPSSGAGPRIDPFVVATHLAAPVGLTMLPDGTALVGERTTGRIVRVQPRAGQPVPTIRTLRGLDTSGDGGLLDLAVSPGYSEDGLIYAYVTTRTDNRVVDFTLHGPVTPVFTGIPKGRTGNTGRIAFGADGNLYIGTGDTGHPARAADPHNLAGKVLRVNEIGDTPPSNPRPSSPVWTSGHRLVNGLCSIPQTRWMLEVEAGTARVSDEVNVLTRGKFYGWPAPRSGAEPPIGRLPGDYPAPGGCAVLAGRLWVTSLSGKALLSAPLRATRSLLATEQFTPFLKNRYGRLKTVVAAADGALWLTTSNRDGHGTPVAADERVIRWVPRAPAGRNPA
ncbi:MAG TPA: PQQ-dependent sugar dehydrogenase [Jatrophihabitans sp.]|jgi:glucose/arabinose dehydrogenase|nr:PQQ-dependent sugar dehydrogenase [Jatrophihabitans sp.]